MSGRGGEGVRGALRSSARGARTLGRGRGLGLGRGRGQGRARGAERYKKRLGSLREGQGFAFQRKQKIKHDYNKLLRKERKAHPPREVDYTESYPDHLRHLYLAEEKMLRKQSKKLEDEKKTASESQPDIQEETIRKKKNKMSSYQKINEEYNRLQAERAKLKAEAEKRQREKEEAQKKYQEQKQEKYKILSQKTKKGQPNLNVQMEYLLKKIEQNRETK
ncbi:thyroid transcription factor 1-associated protein 26 homolog [Callorhinchus milii]|uniref:Thyroid transcription factor 1-associated protein 26-like protein n=1 Tax=Callorhinchus milii TaxID=7868 RepID=A0A4W3GGZ1_CALMI|nr:thyroid transcription factor 1-associated protein 26 homolog [Callorhinchus milii]|eukprot:gi/632971029/ref/XP_007901971.1/ PREDICTED: thyroid transcription factor 1-associated protein 26 [Callorhinchus milii]